MKAVEEKKKMKRGVKIFLGVVGVIVAVAVCFGCIYLYLRHEQNKPVFELPVLEPQASVTALPETAEEAADYIDRLYQTMTTADDVEGEWHTDVSLGDITTPFAPADNALLQYFREQAPGKIAAFYPRASEQLMAQTAQAPAFRIDPAKVVAYNGHQGEVTDSSDDSVHYYLDFTMAPDDVDLEAVKAGDVYKQVAETLSPALTIESFELTPVDETVSCKIDRLSDDLQNVWITKNYQIKATVQFTADYAALAEGGKADVELPYTTVESISFSHYGARFTERQMAVQKGDMKALPIDVTVHSTAMKEDYTLTFTPSVPDVLKVDSDGVMTVLENCTDPVTLTMTLEYDGHTYSDNFTVYITEMEVEADA